ncbi:MAG: DNA alkylation repair protein [Candidatus Fimimonas sp.]
MEYNQLLQLFFQNGNKQLEQFNSKIANSGVRMIGCTVPFVRNVAKQHLHDLDEVVALPTHDYFEVDMFKGMVVSLCKLPFESKKRYLEQFAQTLENWAVCDSNTVKVPRNERLQYFNFFCQLCLCVEPFVCRFGVVNLLANFLDINHVDAIFSLLAKISYGNYYVDMAVAWLIATAMAKCPSQTVQFLEGEGRTVLNVFTYNKALQKMTESRRISDEQKQWARSLKK